MGYRSEVVIAVQMDNNDEESVKDWHLFIAELKTDSKCDSAMRELTKKDNQLDFGGIDMKKCSLYVRFDNVKWYDSDEWVQSFERIVGKASHYCNSGDFNMSACFLRVGEDDDDIKSEYYGELGYELAYLTKPSIEVQDVTFDPNNKLIE